MSRLHGKAILIVDDEPDLIEITSDFLQVEGATVHTAEGGFAAIECLRHHRFDAIVSDMRMPAGSGLELLNALNPRTDPPMVMVTGFADINAIEAYARGLSAIFTKPCDYASLIATLVDLLKTPAERYVVSTRKCETVLRFDFPSLTEAIAKKQFQLGRGGFCLALPPDHSRPPNHVGFDLRFGDVGGELARIEGTGYTRWARAADETSPDAAVGIEIASLTDECREAVLAQMLKPEIGAFIPRG